MRQDNNIEGFDNSNKTSNIEGITVVLYGGKDSFKVFYRGKDIEEATSHDLSELDDFLNNKENKLSPDMIKKINSFVARKLRVYDKFPF